MVLPVSFYVTIACNLYLLVVCLRVIKGLWSEVVARALGLRLSTVLFALLSLFWFVYCVCWMFLLLGLFERALGLLDYYWLLCLLICVGYLKVI